MACLIPFVVAALCGVSAPPPAAAPAPPDAPAAAADRAAVYRADLAALVEQLPQRHIDPFTRVPRERWLEAAAAVESRLPEIRSDPEFVIAISQLVALIGDAHTLVSPPPGGFEFSGYPVALGLFADGPFVTAAPAAYADLIGLRLVRIGDFPYEEAAARIGTLFPSENESWRRVQLQQTLLTAEALQALGLVENPERTELTLADGAGREARAVLAPAKVPLKDWIIRPSPQDPGMPISRQRRPGYYWYEHLPEHKAVYFNYLSCRNDESKPFAAFAEELLAFVEQNDVERLIIDLRRNGGGNSAIMRPLIQGVAASETLNRRGHLFVLIGRRTFSSAQLNAYELRRSTAAVLLGEPTGQKPNAFGETKTFTLPGTGAVVQYSTKRFVTDPDDPPSMMPDERIDATSADHFGGRDPVLERALTWTPEQP